MEKVNRKVTYRLYPSCSQENKMEETLRLHQRLYNACLEQRIDAYKRCDISLTYNDQASDLTLLRSEFPEYRSLNAQSEQVTLKRLDRAYKNFFRRVKSGEKKAGFPRFKSFDRYKGWGYASHGDGWKVFLKEHFLNGYVRLSGIGHIQMRGRARKDPRKKGVLEREPGRPKTSEIIRKSGKWYISITFERYEPGRDSGSDIVGVDWGTSKLLTILRLQDGKVCEKENPRHLKKYSQSLANTQKILSRKKKGSERRKKAKAKLAKIHEKIANVREDHLHKESSKLVANSRIIATEKLNIKATTASGGSRKKGLNRSILDTAPGMFFKFVQYKAVEAGIGYHEIPTRKVKPTQTCSHCGHRAKKTLSERVHSCNECTLTIDRDVNSCLVMIYYALTGSPSFVQAKVTGWEPSSGVEGEVTFPLKRETPPIPEHTH